MEPLFFNTFVVVCGCGGAVVGVVLMIGGEIIELHKKHQCRDNNGSATHQNI